MDLGDDSRRAKVKQRFRCVGTEEFRKLFLRFQRQLTVVCVGAKDLQRLRTVVFRAVKSKDFRVEGDEFGAFDRNDGRPRSDRRDTSSFETSKKRAFRENRKPRRLVAQFDDLLDRLRVVFARFKTERSLADGSQKLGVV